MSFSKSGNVITQTGASTSNRDTPQDLINAGLAGVSSSGSFQININADLIIDGYYDDSGWTYTFGSGYIIRKGANANWTSGITSNNQVTGGFIVNYGGNNAKTINSAAGGVVNWKDVVFRAYTTGRSDLNMSAGSAANIDSSTIWNIDRITVDLTANTVSHFRIEVDTGSIVNVRSINSAILVLSPIVENLVATSPDNKPTGTGLVQKLEVFKDNVTVIEYQPNLQIDGQALGSFHFWADADADGFRTTIYQDMVTPSFFDWTTDYLIYGSGRVIATRRFQLSVNDSSGSLFSGAILKLTNDNDSDSVEISSGSANSTIDQQVNVFVGRKTTFTGAYISPPDQDDLQVKTLTVGIYGKLTSTVPSIDFSSGPVSLSVFLLDNSSISENNKSIVDAYTTLENSQKFYDRFESFRNSLTNINVVNRILLSGSIIDAGSYNVTIDATASAAFDITGNLITIKASTFTGDMVTTGLITLANGAVFNGVRTDANGTVYPDQPISITNISAGSRLRIYNVTTGTETVNTVISGTSYTSSYQEGTGYNDGDTVRVYLTKLGKQEWVGDVIDTSNGFNVLVAQVDDDVYTALGVDGTTVTKFQADYPNNEVDLIIGSDWTMAELYAWWTNNLTTEDGIRNFFGGITAIDQANFRINTAIVNLFLDNATNASYKQADNRRFFRDTGTGYPVRNPTTSGYGLDVVWRNTILIAQTEAGGTSDLNFYDVKRAVKQVITNPKYIKGQK